MAWNPHAGARTIAREWAAQTFSNDPFAVKAIVKMMMDSREVVVNYMTPLGLHHIMDTGHHYGPGPWVSNLRRPEWNPTYYHRADVDGIGFDRSKSGSGATAQYAPLLAKRFEKPGTTPDALLLWFHHLPWSYKTSSGRTVWEELVARYDLGVAGAGLLRKRWSAMEPFVDALRYEDIGAFLVIQEREAIWWRDACLAYFQSVSGLPFPAGTRVPSATLDEYKLKRFPFAPGRGG
jgi:alpha-glucuronidase